MQRVSRDHLLVIAYGQHMFFRTNVAAVASIRVVGSTMYDLTGTRFDSPTCSFRNERVARPTLANYRSTCDNMLPLDQPALLPQNLKNPVLAL